jgi:uncharacterized RDD family membrane protein YckC
MEMNTIKVKTTQNVEVEYVIAGLGDRILAQLIDWGVYFGWSMVMSLLLPVGLLLQKLGNTPPGVVLILNQLLNLPLIFYTPLCEIFMNGQTLGKKAMNIKVNKLSGQAPSVGDYLLRWVFGLIDIIPLGIPAMVCIAATSKGQRLGDLAAGTTVIRLQPVRRKEFFGIHADENHVVTFPEVNALTDTDMALIRKLLYKSLQYKNEVLLGHLAQRTKEVMDVRSDMADEQFLRIVIRDYHHVMSRESVY